ncbi:hypothetical protein GGS24DRAFT_328277 [Hypoxylon argillaceum]|nr:hypothetical protein GGS24DRAFT_328277 [Hypoxylon argillaceum]
MPSKKPAKSLLEIAVYKKIGNQEIHADIYNRDEVPVSKKKLSIALRIHGVVSSSSRGRTSDPPRHDICSRKVSYQFYPNPGFFIVNIT